MNDIIFMGEKSQHRLTGWPGDEIDKVNVEPNFDNRPSSMKCRYFSIENVQKLNNDSAKQNLCKQTKTNINSVTEHDPQLPRRDYLLKRLLQSSTSEKKEENLTDEISMAHNVFLNSKLDRKHSFQDEFIPLFNETNTQEDKDRESVQDQLNEKLNEQPDMTNKQKVYNPKLNTIENYKGPYSVKCLMRSRQYLIDCFKPYSTTYSRSNFEDRLFEILKLKMNIKSKFDDDFRLLRKIQRETALEKQSLIERIEAQDRRLQNYTNSKIKKPLSSSHSYFFTDSDCDDDDELSNSNEVSIKQSVKRKSIQKINKNEPLKKKSKKTITTINLEDDVEEIEEVEEEEEDEDEQNRNLIKMISDVETFENLDYLDDEDENEDDIVLDEDSKCVQFGNYSNLKTNKDFLSKKKNKPKKKFKNKVKSTSTLRKNEPNKSQQQSSAANKTAETAAEGSTSYRIDRIGINKNNNSDKLTLALNKNEQLNEYEMKYRKLRNERNKLLRKKKGIEINMKREQMSNELKSIRKIMKKLRRRHHFNNNNSNKNFNNQPKSSIKHKH